MSYHPAEEERELKIDILKMVMHAGAVRPDAISIDTIISGVARHEGEVVARWVRELVENPDCPLSYYSSDEVAICFENRNAGLLFIRDLEKDPWYQPELD